MPRLALVLYVAYALLAFGWRSYVQYRRTGSTGWRGFRGRVGSPEWFGGALFAVAVVTLFFAPILAIRGVDPPLAPLASVAGDRLALAGAALSLLGGAATLFAQLRMGASWRIGVDPAERTSLVTSGPFGVVRNPIFAAMIPSCLGVALMVPNVTALVAFAALVIAIDIQVRLVEEPYLREAHGEAYARYAARVGRFVPGFGRLRDR